MAKLLLGRPNGRDIGLFLLVVVVSLARLIVFPHFPLFFVCCISHQVQKIEKNRSREDIFCCVINPEVIQDGRVFSFEEKKRRVKGDERETDRF